MAEYDGSGGRQDERHVAKIRNAGDRTISDPGTTKSISPPAQRQAKIITPARSANRTPTGRR